MDSVTVIIASYDRPDALKETVDGVLLDLRDSDEIIIVDQAPTVDLSNCWSDPRVHYIVRAFPNADRARNAGVLVARGDICLFLDDDVIVETGLVDAHRTAYADMQIGAVAGHINEIGETDVEADPRMKDLESGWRYIHFNHRERCEVMHVRTCNASFRARLVKELGGFDPYHRMWRDDSDLAFRIRRAGYRIVFEPTASLVHLSSARGGMRAIGKQRSEKAISGELAMYRRHFLHYRDNLYFLCKFFCGRERLGWIVDAYTTYVGVSRWPWRLVAKNAVFAVALVQGWYWSKTKKPPFFESAIGESNS